MNRAAAPQGGPESAIPDSLPVHVIMECRPSSSPWTDHEWSAIGVTVGEGPGTRGGPGLVLDRGGLRRLKYGGFRIHLHRDECESYYYNLRSPKPGCFVIARPGEGDEPVPFRVSLSFDEANAYQEGEDMVYTVPIPAELYRWTEQFVLQHYVPEKRVKRKRADWKKPGAAERG